MPIEMIYLTGHAQLPQGTVAQDSLAVTAVVEARHGVILQATATLATEQGAEFVARLLVGRSLEDRIEEVLDELRLCYHGSSQNALIAAIKDMVRRYQTYKAGRLTGRLS